MEILKSSRKSKKFGKKYLVPENSDVQVIPFQMLLILHSFTPVKVNCIENDGAHILIRLEEMKRNPIQENCVEFIFRSITTENGEVPEFQRKIAEQHLSGTDATIIDSIGKIVLTLQLTYIRTCTFQKCYMPLDGQTSILLLKKMLNQWQSFETRIHYNFNSK